MVWLILFGNAWAEDFGSFGKTYPISEQNALEFIQERLAQLEKEGRFSQLETEFKNTVQNKVKNPVGIGLPNTRVARSFHKDLTVTVPYDIRDHWGSIIQKAGTKINPLSESSSQKKIIFFNGEDKKQLKWALAEHLKSPYLVKLVLTQGRPIDLMEELKLRFYFDQAGALSGHFGIEHVPARVSQDQARLLIEELVL
ncbi:MAG: type-F conjugative transfer system protein TraW [Gammaproteobacteria bacterium]